jgi:predicted TIM-barrel fold metal-dependent hydrolase
LTNKKLMGILDSIYDVIFSGVLDRFPRLQLVMVENEIGWIPWMLQIWDRYFQRSRVNPLFQSLELELSPSEYFLRNIWATFFEDAVGASLLGPWGVDNCMWSSDYPHANSTWPHSRETVAKELAHLSSEDRAKVLWSNVTDLYHLPVPTPL